MLLLVPKPEAPAWTLPAGVKQGLAWTIIGLTALNAATTFLQCGPIECPDNPVRYWAFSMRGNRE